MANAVRTGFWGSEKGIWRLPGGGIYSTAVGYAASLTPNPTYEEACSGRTGCTEGVQVVYDPAKISFVDIIRWFWESHDPCSGMGQGNDRGTQYRSAAYWFDDEQRQLLLASKDAYQAALSAKGINRAITTELLPASEHDPLFYFAEDYHQQYLAKPGSRPYCSAQPQCVPLPPFDSWAPSALSHHEPKLPDGFWETHGGRSAPRAHAPSRPHALVPSLRSDAALRDSRTERAVRVGRVVKDGCELCCPGSWLGEQWGRVETCGA